MKTSLVLALVASIIFLCLAFFFMKPLRGLCVLMLRSALGWAGLYILNFLLAFSGFSFGINIASASIVGILGLPGLVLLGLLKFLF